jgi:Rrf2 family protein
MSELVQISEAALLALHSMVLIAQAKGGWVSVHEMAKQTGASENHLAKVMQRLTRANLVNSVRGPKGGFLLAQDASKIFLLDIYEAIEGKVGNGSCPFHKESCLFQMCIFHGLIGKTTAELVKHLASTSLESMA